MHRPSDQAKLLFFALLRGTVSALATEPKVATAVTGNVNLAVQNGGATSLSQQFPNIQLRLARRADVPSIQRCNLATLPENYNSQFYVNHMRQWPDLCLVAEDTMAKCSSSSSTTTDHSNYYNNNNNGPMFGANFPGLGGVVSGRSESNVVAYVLGKVEQRPRRIIPSRYYTEGYQIGDNNGNDDDWNEQQQQENERDRFIGHVTSLAVLKPYRRQGLAQALMRQLHFHLEEAHGAGSVGLHVRKSNEAACRLYKEFGYQIDLTIPAYYQDGEDAYFMKKILDTTVATAATTTTTTTTTNSGNNNGTTNKTLFYHHHHPAMSLPQAPKLPFFGRRPLPPWETGPLDLRLPRTLLPDTAVTEEQNSGLLTGSM